MNNQRATYTWAIRHRFITAARMLKSESGTLLDIGSRDRILTDFLANPRIQYSSADVVPGHDYQIDLEKQVPLADGSFDHVVALDVLEHVNNIHDAFAEVLRIAGRSVVISLPNLASLRHRFIFLIRGRMGTDKYDLPSKLRPDRHHWLTIYPHINRFVEENAAQQGFAVRSLCVESETGVLKPLAAMTLPIGIRLGGLLSARSLFHLVRNGS